MNYIQTIQSKIYEIRLTNRIADDYKEQFLDDTDLCDKLRKYEKL